MMLIFTFLLIATLETATGKTANNNTDLPIKTEEIEEPEPDLCVGCPNNSDDDDDNNKVEEPELTVDIVIDPLTGKVRYVIRGLRLE